MIPKPGRRSDPPPAGAAAARGSAWPAWLGLGAFALLFGLTIVDWMAYHEIFHEYASPETLAHGSGCRECEASLPAWSNADGEWHAVYLGLIVRAALALMGIGTTFCLTGRGSWRRKGIAVAVTGMVFWATTQILWTVWQAYRPTQ